MKINERARHVFKKGKQKCVVVDVKIDSETVSEFLDRKTGAQICKFDLK